MASSMQTLRGEIASAEGEKERTAVAVPLQPWLAGRPPEDRLVDLLGFALASERGLLPSPENMAQMRQRATAMLAEYSIRHLHNKVAEIRQEAIMEQLGRTPRPPGLLKLLLANLLALTLAAALGGWLYLNQDSWLPQTLAALAGLFPG